MASVQGLQRQLEQARNELLDLSTRNRLLNTSRSQSRSTRLEVVDEKSDEVFRHLVVEAKAMSFLPRAEDPDEDPVDGERAFELQPVDDEPESDGPAARHLDDKLQTAQASDRLQKKLLKLFYDARTFEQEQGVNTLYLALGFLKWFDKKNPDRERHAPLLLIPVTLDRTSATARFKVRYSQDDVTTNLSLQQLLKTDFGIELPEVPDPDDIDPGEYFSSVRAEIGEQPGWEVLNDDMVLWIFSFAKLLMYRDLDPVNWPDTSSLDKNLMIQGLLGDGFAAQAPLCDEEEHIDDVLEPQELIHVLDADSSQTLVVEEAKRGSNLVIQGPPGTGKSQTIANLIAAAVVENKTVLFMAEKMAALEVVERRLREVGIGDMCLELHSNKANKRAVLQDLERTLALGKPKRGDFAAQCAELAQYRNTANLHVDVIHQLYEPSQLTPYQIVGHLVRLSADETRVPDFALDATLEWTPTDFQTRRSKLDELVKCVKETGTPHRHVWRGVTRGDLLPSDMERITAKLPDMISRLDRLAAASSQLALMLGLDAPADATGISQLARLAQRLKSAPPLDSNSLGHAVWVQQRNQIDELVQTGIRFAGLHDKLSEVVVESGWQTNLTATRRNLAAYGRSWFRFLNRNYREAQATLRGILIGESPRPLEERLAIVDELVAGQRAQREITADAATLLGQSAFGTFWNGENSDWTALSDILDWDTKCTTDRIHSNFRKILAALGEFPDVTSPLDQIRADLQAAVEALKTLFDDLKLDLQMAFDNKNLLNIALDGLSARLNDWSAASESLFQWTNYALRRNELEGLGLSDLMTQIYAGTTHVNEAVARFEMAYYDDLIRAIWSDEPHLARFNGTSHEQHIETFRELDTQRIKMTKYEVAASHHTRLPNSLSDVGEVGLLRREMQKKRRHLPIRKLLAQAGSAVQAVKPVFMMSPISVAQYLKPGGTTFDLLVIDEASQVQPVDALGAVARARQIVVVGDSKQLPPTRFFNRMLGDDAIDDENDTDLNAGDMESILGLCCAQNVPQRMLSWHYRSLHHSLIAVSNREFYDNRLHVFPSPGEPAHDEGLTFHYVEDGVFERGGSATNPVEARRVAEAVMEHARQHPDKTLGVGAFSVSQRDAILDQLERLRRADPSLETFFNTNASEPFFVKNLENIQGDERAVIFISVGYGKDANGKMSMNFGPLSNDGGERRLNVLITRARNACRVFSSIRADDIDLTRARSRGAQAFKTFLKYAESQLLGDSAEYANDHNSEFEYQVAQAVQMHGYETRANVGVAGSFIDVAVVDPDDPQQFILGIECDGANYNSSRSARDRDRLRQSVLGSRKWVLHRVWILDWYQRPDDELSKLLTSIDRAEALRHQQADIPNAKQSPPSAKPAVILRQDVSPDDESTAETSLSQPYIVASFRIHADQEIHELSPQELAQVLMKIIDKEGPIHRQEIARRVTDLWGLQRTGSRIRDAVDRALDSLGGGSVEVTHGEFYTPRDQQDIPVRNRGDVSSNSLRKPEMLPPSEIREALTALVRVHIGLGPDEVTVEAAKLFGFRSTSARLKRIIANELDDLVAEQVLETRNGKLHLQVESPRPHA